MLDKIGFVWYPVAFEFGCQYKYVQVGQVRYVLFICFFFIKRRDKSNILIKDNKYQYLFNNNIDLYDLSYLTITI